MKSYRADTGTVEMAIAAKKFRHLKNEVDQWISRCLFPERKP
jgi:hypothetical protein